MVDGRGEMGDRGRKEKVGVRGELEGVERERGRVRDPLLPFSCPDTSFDAITLTEEKSVSDGSNKGRHLL